MSLVRANSIFLITVSSYANKDFCEKNDYQAQPKIIAFTYLAALTTVLNWPLALACFRLLSDLCERGM